MENAERIASSSSMEPYVDSEFGLLDPDAPGNWSLEEFEQLYCCLKDEGDDRFGEVEPALKEFYQQLLFDPLRPGELITVPTDSLFIEALPGDHPVFRVFALASEYAGGVADVLELDLADLGLHLIDVHRTVERLEVFQQVVIEGNGQVAVPHDDLSKTLAVSPTPGRTMHFGITARAVTVGSCVPLWENL